MLRGRLLVLMLFLAVAAGCASGPATAGRTGRSDLITEEQLRARGFGSVYDAVETLRSNWLRTRGSDTLAGTPTQIQVYVDNTRLGGVENLRGISPLSVSYIQWYNANDATARWGIGHGAGVIYVSTAPMR
jgi:hypothetical protein